MKNGFLWRTVLCRLAHFMPFGLVLYVLMNALYSDAYAASMDLATRPETAHHDLIVPALVGLLVFINIAQVVFRQPEISFKTKRVLVNIRRWFKEDDFFVPLILCVVWLYVGCCVLLHLDGVY